MRDALPMADPGTLVVSETFSTLQGEGPSTGRRAFFVRLGGCLLKCDFCDSQYTWNAKEFDLRAELDRRRADDIVTEAASSAATLTVITGGEPLLQQRYPGWRRLLTGLKAAGHRVEVETSGTVLPDVFSIGHVDQWNVSPKLSHSGEPAERRLRPDVLDTFRLMNGVAWKFVCRDRDDVAETVEVVHDHRIDPTRVWIMPEGTTPDRILTVMRTITQPALDCGFNVTTRLHVLLWPDEGRGR